MIKEKDPVANEMLDLNATEIFGIFQSAFGGIFNVVELAIEDTVKAQKAKELIGSILIHTRDKCINFVNGKP